MESEIVYKANEADLKAAMREILADNIADGIYSRFYNVYMNASEVAKLHNVSAQTVLRYVKDGRLKPDSTKGQSYSFRVSEALKFDFVELRKLSRLNKSL